MKCECETGTYTLPQSLEDEQYAYVTIHNKWINRFWWTLGMKTQTGYFRCNLCKMITHAPRSWIEL